MKRSPEREEQRRVRRAVLIRDGWHCRRCGRRNDLHSHHIVFRSHGGANSTDNEVTLCNLCHDMVHGRNWHWSLEITAENVAESVNANKVLKFITSRKQ